MMLWAGKEYVCGFMFSNPDETGNCKVILIRKNRPDWQKGRLNGIGGKVEPDLDPSFQAAMVREFHEETGHLSSYDDWEMFCAYTGLNARPGQEPERYRVYFFRAMPQQFPVVSSKTDEEIEIINTRVLPLDVIWNLNWLIPMALDTSLDFSVPVLVKEE